ncbi:deoxyguanosinetriphosphate triphosphohydrolase [bacterium]|nr:MAG: deoxyguanosinetriphosphate triphosphohydrolase [bacterium]
MPAGVREAIENRERESFSSYAQLSSESLGRQTPEAPDLVRTAFMRDRDRILHSKPFRRLKHKTQVFLAPYGDHYRTRLTHTLEVAQVARTVGRALRLNEDLIEAIALGHDVGHTPFGHAGEAALDEALREHGGVPTQFRHHEQSLRIVDVLTPMNLSEEVRLGIGGHSKGRNDLTAYDGEPTSTLEAAVVRVSDRVAYLNHDLDDALRAGILKEIPAPFRPLGDSHGERVGRMVSDVIVNSLDQPAIRFSDGMLSSLNEIKAFLFENVYDRYGEAFPDVGKSQDVVKELFRWYVQPGRLPEGYEGTQGAVDYIAGMTDRFAIEVFERLRVPSGWRP